MIDGCKSLYGCWVLNTGYLEEQPVLLTAEPLSVLFFATTSTGYYTFRNTYCFVACLLFAFFETVSCYIAHPNLIRIAIIFAGIKDVCHHTQNPVFLVSSRKSARFRMKIHPVYFQEYKESVFIGKALEMY